MKKARKRTCAMDGSQARSPRTRYYIRCARIYKRRL